MFQAAKIPCVLAHDQILFRQGLRRLMEDEPDIAMVSEAGNAAECLRKVYELRPDVVVADAATFGMSASDAEFCVARESPQTKIVFLSVQEEFTTPFTDRRSATAGCAVRNTSVQELLEMIRNACSANRTNLEDTVQEFNARRPMET